MNRNFTIHSSVAAALLLAAAPLAMAAGPAGTGHAGGAAYANPGATQSRQAAQSNQSWQSRQASSTASTQSAAHERWEKVATPPQADVRPFEHAKLSLTQAIHKAEQKHQGKTLEARFEMWHGKPAYFIRTLASNDRIWEGHFNADTGKLIGKAHSRSVSQLHAALLKKDVSAAQNAQTSLTQAVDKAQQQKGGKAIMASLKPGSHGGAAYDLSLVKNGRLHTAMVDASNGKLR